MSDYGLNINEAAKQLNVSTRTIRRHIKAGKIKAELVKGSFGEEYRILELPPQFDPNTEFETESANEQTIDNSVTAGSGSVQGMELIRELQEKNLALAAQLGAAAERIHRLENQLKLLASPPSAQIAKEPWWRRFQSFFTRHRQSGSNAAHESEEKG